MEQHESNGVTLGVLTQFSNVSEILNTFDYSDMEDRERAEQIQDVSIDILVQACRLKALVKKQAIDIDFIVNIVASYLLTVEANTEGKEIVPPSEIFLSSLIPVLNNEATIDVETIETEEEESDEGQGDRPTEQ